MTESDLTLLHQHGFSADVLTVLTHLGYHLIHHNTVTEVIEVATPAGAPCPHGFEMHRNDSPQHLRETIFSAGVFHHQKQTRDAFQSLLTAAGLSHR